MDERNECRLFVNEYHIESTVRAPWRANKHQTIIVKYKLYLFHVSLFLVSYFADSKIVIIDEIESVTDFEAYTKVYLQESP